MQQITSFQRSIYSLYTLDQKFFFIPDFQREFVWTNNEAKQLFDDFREDANSFYTPINELPGYLLGNIVLINPDVQNKYDVIDGQQRLVTISLLAKVLYDRLFKKSRETQNQEDIEGWDQLKVKVKDIYSFQLNIGQPQMLRISFSSYLDYSRMYTDLILGNEIRYDDLSPSEMNLQLVYNTLKNEIEELDDEQLNNFTLYFLSNVQIIETVAPSEERAYQLFEVLNTRGRSLEPLDLIKNIFLKTIFENSDSARISTQFNANWKNFTENLEISRTKVISSSTFLKHYIIGMYGRNVKKDKIYPFLKELHLNANQILDLSEKLKKTSKIYADIEKGNSAEFISDTIGYSELNDVQKSNLEEGIKVLFNILNVNQFHSLLIPFYSFDFDKKKNLISAAIKYGASVMFAQRQTNVIENDIEQFMLSYWQDTDVTHKFSNLLNKINLEKNNFILEFQSNLETFNFSNRRGRALMLLKFIDFYGNNNQDILILPKTGNRSMTLEHIIPETPEEPNDFQNNGFQDTTEYKNYLNLIGNLTLLTRSENSSVGNKRFSLKRDTYQVTPFTITSNIVEKRANNYQSGIEFHNIQRINQWNPSIEEYKNLIEDPLQINEYWTKEAINFRGKSIKNYLLELLS